MTNLSNYRSLVIKPKVRESIIEKLPVFDALNIGEKKQVKLRESELQSLIEILQFSSQKKRQRNQESPSRFKVSGKEERLSDFYRQINLKRVN